MAIRDILVLLAMCAAVVVASCEEPIGPMQPAWSVECGA